MKFIGCLVLALGLTSGCTGVTATPRPSSPPHTTCGHAAVGGPEHAVVSSGGSALTCFVAAVRRCRAASVSVTEFSVDTGTDLVATIEPGTPCRARYVSQAYTANFGGEEFPASTTDCDVSVTPVGVHFHCAGLDDDVPVPTSS